MLLLLLLLLLLLIRERDGNFFSELKSIYLCKGLLFEKFDNIFLSNPPREQHKDLCFHMYCMYFIYKYILSFFLEHSFATLRQ